MGKKPQTAIVWPEAQKTAFTELAKSMGHSDSTLGREILIEYLSCYLPDAEFRALKAGPPRLVWLQEAVNMVKRRVDVR